MRFTKIVATIGPATCSEKNIQKLGDMGVSICRLNFSHGSYEVHGATIDTIRLVNKKGYSLGVMLDTKGPEVRTGDVEKPIVIKAGDEVLFTSNPTGNEKKTTIKVDYDHFATDVKNARCILIDNGAIEFSVLSIQRGVVLAKALEDGKIGSRRHVNLPGAHISLPSFTKKGWEDIAFGVSKGVDFIATSFVRTGDDIRELRRFLQKKKSHAHIIAKIETPEAVQNFDEIVDAADGIMVARGDLGAEVPFEDVPMIQDELVRICREKGKPVIVATHMLESMILSPMPTRAEVTDIAYASKIQADSTMLSGETTTGLYPFKAVEAMVRVLETNEKIMPSFRREDDCEDCVAIDLPRREQALAACVLGTKLHADALIVMSRRGRTAAAVSNWRPLIPIYAFADTEHVQRRMMLLWGVQPQCIEFSTDPEKTIQNAIKHLKEKKVFKKGQCAIVVSDIHPGNEPVMTVQVRTIV